MGSDQVFAQAAALWNCRALSVMLSCLHLLPCVLQELAKEGLKVRVVSMPCMELFEKQSQEYKDSVLPKHVSILQLAGVARVMVLVTSRQHAAHGQHLPAVHMLANSCLET